MMKLHLGCGTNYLKGWVNVDLDSPVADTRLDLRKPLPYPNESAQFIFNEHFIEHITQDEAVILLQECKRILKPDGILRISTPSLEWVLAMYVGNKLDEWADVEWIPESRCKLLNEAMRSWGHQFIYDLEELTWLLHKVGFGSVKPASWRTSSYLDLSDLECRPYHREIIVEAQA